MQNLRVMNPSSSVILGLCIQQTTTFGTTTTVNVTNRFVLPASMQNYLTKTEKKVVESAKSELKANVAVEATTSAAASATNKAISNKADEKKDR